MPESNLDQWARDVVERSKGSFGAGLGLTLVFHLLALVAMFFIAMVGLELAIYLAMYIGLSQLLYMIPAIVILRRRGETETAKGLILGASLTFLLNATCSGLFFLAL